MNTLKGLKKGLWCIWWCVLVLWCVLVWSCVVLYGLLKVFCSSGGVLVVWWSLVVLKAVWWSLYSVCCLVVVYVCLVLFWCGSVWWSGNTKKRHRTHHYVFHVSIYITYYINYDLLIFLGLITTPLVFLVFLSFTTTGVGGVSITPCAMTSLLLFLLTLEVNFLVFPKGVCEAKNL